jgi:hemerythrin-like domain-containing protein
MTTPEPAETLVPAVALLVREHDAARDWLATLIAAVANLANDAAGALTAVDDAIAFLRGGLELHIAREEGPLFPLLKAELPRGDRLIDEMVAEHDLIRMKRDDLREALEELLAGHDDVRDDLAALQALARANAPVQALAHAAADLAEKMRVHFENEEELVFPLAPRLLDAAALAHAYDEMLLLH